MTEKRCQEGLIVAVGDFLTALVRSEELGVRGLDLIL